MVETAQRGLALSPLLPPKKTAPKPKLPPWQPKAQQPTSPKSQRAQLQIAPGLLINCEKSRGCPKLPVLPVHGLVTLLSSVALRCLHTGPPPLSPSLFASFLLPSLACLLGLLCCGFAVCFAYVLCCPAITDSASLLPCCCGYRLSAFPPKRPRHLTFPSPILLPTHDSRTCPLLPSISIFLFFTLSLVHSFCRPLYLPTTSSRRPLLLSRLHLSPLSLSDLKEINKHSICFLYRHTPPPRNYQPRKTKRDRQRARCLVSPVFPVYLFHTHLTLPTPPRSLDPSISCFDSDRSPLF